VAAAFDRWETDCFAKLVGDWTVAIVNPRTRSVLLAKDFIGTRHLHYFVDECQVAWSTALDPLVWLSGRSSALCEEYIAGWFSYLPAAHLTPYTGIHCVPPSFFVLLSARGTKVQKYWDFDPHHKIRYATDAEYEDHFRAAFCEAVRRRLRCDRPVLAELSGGMDSSSIVCVADEVMSSGSIDTPRLDTLSYYDDSEPNWNERPYFSKVEEKRGCIGCHIDLSGQDFSLFDHDNRRFVVTPGSGRETLSELTKQLTAWMSSHGNRVVLSGIGGDEVTGGVPAPIPELQDLIVRLRLIRLAACLKVWALQKRKPWLHLLVESLRPFLSPDWVGMPKHKHPPQWLAQEFVKRNHSALHGYHRRLELCGAMPSFQENMATLEGLRRQFACDGLSSEPLCERRYPFLDRDLLEFLYAIPRQQFVRPGQRRSLMRRALVGIVPEEILNLKRKAFVSRGPMTKLSDQWPRLLKLSEEMVGGSLGVVDAGRFREVLNRARQGVEVPTVALLRTLEIEY
jgi:asparagine synthase (glutamine-hydrolysing)